MKRIAQFARSVGMVLLHWQRVTTRSTGFADPVSCATPEHGDNIQKATRLSLFAVAARSSC